MVLEPMTPPQGVDPSNNIPPMDASMQAPQDGAMPPMDQGASGQMATPEEMQQLQELFDKIQSKYAEVNSAKFSSENEALAAKQDLTKQVFQMMKDQGVDLADVNSIKDFLAQLEQESPEMYDILVSVLDSIFADIPTGEEDATDPNAGLPPEMGQGIPPDMSQGLPPEMGQATPDMSQGLPEQAPPSKAFPGLMNKIKQ